MIVYNKKKALKPTFQRQKQAKKTLNLLLFYVFSTLFLNVICLFFRIIVIKY